jgi:hypothetical protein
MLLSDDEDDDSAAEEEVQKAVTARERELYQTVLKKEDAEVVPGFDANPEPIAGRLYWSTSTKPMPITISNEIIGKGQVKDVWKASFYL